MAFPVATKWPAPADTPLSVNCPKCGQLLYLRGFRAEADEDGQPEIVDIYACFEDGVFTLTNRKRLVDGV